MGKHYFQADEVYSSFIPVLASTPSFSFTDISIELMARHKQKLQLVYCSLIFFYITVPLCLAENKTQGDYERLGKKLFIEQNHFIPKPRDGKALKVQFGFHLINIVEVNAKMQYITVHGWVLQRWHNHFHRWNPEDYNGIEKLTVPSESIWVPDILLYNNLDEQDRVGGGKDTYKTKVMIHSNGTNTWSSPALFKTFCRIQVRYFPLDTQTCILKFGSWTSSIDDLDLEAMDLKFPTKFYTKNGEWSVFNISLYREEDIYYCCDKPFVDIKFAIYISREALDYLINLIIPCCLISSMIFLGFILPPESGERIGLSITVLLAMTVFQQLTSAIMPAYDFPILGQYYFAIVLEISVSLVVTTMILNFYHRTEREMPWWLKKLLLQWVARFVFLSKEVEKKYSINQCSLSNAVLKLHSKQFNDSKNQGSKRSRKETMTSSTAPGYDSCYGDNIFGNDQALDKEVIEMRAPSHVNTYPFSLNDMDNRENEKKEDKEFHEKERELRHWEWTMAARILDRCVLVVAIFIGVVTVTTVFLRAPSLWKDTKELSLDKPITITRNSHT